MNMTSALGNNLYCLLWGDDGAGDPRIVEFEAPSAQSALFLAARHCPGRKVEVFENGRSLGNIWSEAGGGYWVITPPRATGPGAAAMTRPAKMRPPMAMPQLAR